MRDMTSCVEKLGSEGKDWESCCFMPTAMEDGDSVPVQSRGQPCQELEDVVALKHELENH